MDAVLMARVGSFGNVFFCCDNEYHLYQQSCLFKFRFFDTVFPADIYHDCFSPYYLLCKRGEAEVAVGR